VVYAHTSKFTMLKSEKYHSVPWSANKCSLSTRLDRRNFRRVRTRKCKWMSRSRWSVWSTTRLVIGFRSSAGESVFLFTMVSMWTLGCTQPPFRWILRTLSSILKRLEREAGWVHTHLVLRLRVWGLPSNFSPKDDGGCSGTDFPLPSVQNQCWVVEDASKAVYLCWGDTRFQDSPDSWRFRLGFSWSTSANCSDTLLLYFYVIY
jgi:hypothetical protein